MPIKIEQITKTGLVVSDFDNKLNKSDIFNILSQQSYLQINSSKTPYIAKYKNKNINLCIKNISYLGMPHLHYKKRIQIPKEWTEVLQQNNTLLLGIYSYDGVKTFCLFDTISYRDNNLNNSSAHIYTMDLHKARKLGIFKKIDKKGNKLIVFTESSFQKVFNEVLFNRNIPLSNELNIFNNFSKTLHTEWRGINCYQEMISADFNHAYQSEWAGFYLEYMFRQFISKNPHYQKYCKYIQDKSGSGIDLDLWFEKEQFYGDLKTHTIGKNLLGNDKESILQAIEQYKKIWYIAFSHYTKKDIECDGIVTKFWNSALNKRHKKTGKGKPKKINSYLSKMKNTVKLNQFIILEINKFNVEHLSDFDQGRNSNNQARKVKISIKRKDLENDNFVIYRQRL